MLACRLRLRHAIPLALVPLLWGAACDAEENPAPNAPSLSTPRAAAQQQGQVQVTLAGAALAIGDRIEITVTNSTDRAVYAEDMKSDCTIVTLERQSGDEWEPRPDCIMERAPFTMTIEPGESRAVTINPHSTHFGSMPGAAEPGIGAGTYRIRFSYRLAAEPKGSEPESAVSPEFTIG